LIDFDKSDVYLIEKLDRQVIGLALDEKANNLVGLVKVQARTRITEQPMERNHMLIVVA